jgi:Ca2+-transporting ATPase
MLQFWNMFNAKMYRSGKSFFKSLTSKESHTTSFYLIAAVILLGQVLIVNLLGNFFDVAPLHAPDWWLLLLVTSPVLLLPELLRLFRK